ncbi:MAG: hypothetical protein LUD51_01010 [Clostridia bacterium]|nr:hypothetical protein [Clostridia bacterium]
MEKVAEAIKAVIDREGPGYLDTNAYDVYAELLKNKAADEKTARMMLITLLAGTHRQKARDASAYSAYIQQECCLTESAADEIAGIYAELFKASNRREWKGNREKGFIEFCENTWHFELESTAEWNCRGRHMDCFCSVEMDVAVDKPDLLHKALEKPLSKNPFMTADAIYSCLEEKMQKTLDHDFAEYCDIDDYYPPYSEEYLDNCRYWIDKFCPEYGLKLEGFEFDGRDDW